MRDKHSLKILSPNEGSTLSQQKGTLVTLTSTIWTVYSSTPSPISPATHTCPKRNPQRSVSTYLLIGWYRDKNYLLQSESRTTSARKVVKRADKVTKPEDQTENRLN